MKGKLTTALIVLVFIAGLGLLLYPTVSHVWNSMHQSRAVANYDRETSTASAEEKERVLEEARAYNRALLENRHRFPEDPEGDEAYRGLLRLGRSSTMGYIDIPKIGVKLPLYHGTGNAVLQVGVGHIAGSSLPVGGESTHAAFSGHTGLPSARLMTDMDQLEAGDLFMLHILGDRLVYQVDQRVIVEPNDMSPLDIVPGEDYASLVTCTPYGINSHRLVVRGVRVFPEEAVDGVLIPEAVYMGSGRSAALLGAPVFALLLALYAVLFGRRKRGRQP